MAEPLDRRIGPLARGQRGYVTRPQLLELGLSRQSIVRRVAAGRLIPVYTGVYAVGHLPTLPHDRGFAAVLACGQGALLSHDSAAAVWEIYRRWTTPLHVTVPGAPRRREGIQVHRAKLSWADRDRQLGLPVTSPARTLLDIAPDLNERALTRAVNDLQRRHFLNLGDLAATLIRSPRHPGAAALRPLIESPSGPTASEFEDAFKAFCKRFDFPLPLVNTKVAGIEVDALFPAEQVIVELDGWKFHSDRATFESDRDRDATLLALGFVTVRITWKRLIEKSEPEARRLGVILENRRSAMA